jgi:molybdate transport system regulatory protein
MTRIRLQVFLGEDEHKIGPGKIDLLEAIREHRSISGAARAMEMAYRHAWEMADDLNRCFDEPVLEAAPGGAAGGGARLTALGESLVDRYRKMERATRKAIRRDLAVLDARLAPRRRRRP